MGDATWVTLDQAAEISGLPVAVVHGLAVRGQVAAERDPDTGEWSIDPDDLHRYSAPDPL